MVTQKPAPIPIARRFMKGHGGFRHSFESLQNPYPVTMVVGKKAIVEKTGKTQIVWDLLQRD